MCYGTCTMTSLVISTEKVDGYRQTKVSTHKENDLDFGYKKRKLLIWKRTILRNVQ